jgi:outer membrane protein assembly factor BamB
MPLVLANDQILLSLGYGQGSKLIQVSKDEESFSTSELWSSRFMKAKFTNLISHKDHIYGLDDGILACIDQEDGRRKWKDGRFGHGQVLLRGNHILIMAENGEVILTEASPNKQIELSRFAALDSKTWNPHTLVGEYLLVRNHREAACYKLPVAKTTTNAPKQK